MRLDNLYPRAESREAMSMARISCIHCEEMIRFCSGLVKRKAAFALEMSTNYLQDIRPVLSQLRRVTHLVREHRHIEVNGFTNNRWNLLIANINDCLSSSKSSSSAAAAAVDDAADDTYDADDTNANANADTNADANANANLDEIVLLGITDKNNNENENEPPPPPRRITLLNEAGRQQSALQFEFADIEEWSTSSAVTKASWWLAIRSVFTDVQHYRRKRVVINQGYDFWRNLYDLPDSDNTKAQFIKRALYIEEMADREVRLAGLTMVVLIAGLNLIISNYTL